MASIRTIVKKLIPTHLFRAIEPYGHLVEAVIMNVRYGFPSRGMRVIGVTGTNGKTTTTLLIQKMMHESGIKTAVLSTVAYGVGGDIQPQIEHITTAQAGILQRRLRDFKRAGVEWVVVEASSHSLAQHRVWGLQFEIAVMTNITHEHLDYHGTFERYLFAKRRLFVTAGKYGSKFGVANADDPNCQRFIEATPRNTTYGIKHGDLRASKIRLASDHSTFTATIGEEHYDVRINIPGDFNVSNSLAAVAVGRELGLTKTQIQKGIAALAGVEGRMTVINEGQKFKAIVDFAGTPDAFERLFHGLRPATKGKLVVVFGSPAQRDMLKRPIQGEIAGRNADALVITEENDRDEDGNKIMSEIAAGAEKAGMKKDKNLFLVGNREEAIGFALTLAEHPNDVVIILGKGHEKTIERADVVHPWSDIEVTKTALQELVKSKGKT